MFAGAAMAVDDDADTYWASKFDDTKAPVEYVVDFGEVQKLSSMELSWEFPAKSFAVSASLDGEHFTDVYATDANVLKNSRISLGGASARKLRISMLEVRGLRVARWRSSAASARSVLVLSFPSLVAFILFCLLQFIPLLLFLASFALSPSFAYGRLGQKLPARDRVPLRVSYCVVLIASFLCSLIPLTDGWSSSEISTCLHLRDFGNYFVQVPRPCSLWY